MQSTKEQYFGEDYLVEIGDDAVEVWRILAREQTGKNSWRSSLTIHDRRSLPLSEQDAQNLVAEFASDAEPEKRQSLISLLTK